jgi:pyruvate,water dikinase
MTDFITPFDFGGSIDHAKLGGKCASLAALTAAGAPVPPGFAVTTDAYAAFLAADDLLGRLLPGLDAVDADDTAAIERASSALRTEMQAAALPVAVVAAIRHGYADLIARCGAPVPVAVRSSATAEDLPDASFAGQQDTYLWVLGIDDVLDAVRRCWSSLFTARAISYRARLGIRHGEVLMAVGVQKMVNARVAGVALTLDPANGDRSKIAIEGTWGVGELLVSGEITPDNFLVDKVMLQSLRSRIADKPEMLVPDVAARKLVRRAVPAELRTAACLTPDELTAVARLAKFAERHYRVPQDIEWAIDHDLPAPANVVLLQSRPETGWAGRPRAFAGATSQAGIGSVVDTLLAPLSSSQN